MPALHAWFGSGVCSKCAAVLLSTHRLTAGGLLVALQSKALDDDAAWVGLERCPKIALELRAAGQSAVGVRTSRSLRQYCSSTAWRECRKWEHCQYTCVAAARQSSITKHYVLQSWLFLPPSLQ